MRVAADHQYEHGDFNQAVETYSKAIDIQITGILKEDKRGRAILLANRAVCYRRAAAAPELGQKDAMELLQKVCQVFILFHTSHPITYIPHLTSYYIYTSSHITSNHNTKSHHITHHTNFYDDMYRL